MTTTTHPAEPVTQCQACDKSHCVLFITPDNGHYCDRCFDELTALPIDPGNRAVQNASWLVCLIVALLVIGWVMM